MPRISIDGQALEVPAGLTVLRAAEEAGIHIPHFCYHPAFPPEGSCRMCLVEIEGLPKLELACSTTVKDGMKVQTKSPKVVEARKAVLEFLLAEHPLDCPICDKAGECKLQDYFEEYGLFRSEFNEAKERREKKVRLGKNLILDRERCILCTRCVRFLNEITKTEDAGVLHRGIHSEIGVFESEFIDNNYSGNLAEICPVGAITDTDFRFKTRTWFLEKKESICPFCGRGCNIFIDSHPGFPRVPRSRRVYRFRARENPKVNSYWICDFGRYGYPALDQGRQKSLVWKKEGRDTVLSWEKVLRVLTEKIRSMIHRKKLSRLGIVLHTNLTNEELFLAKRLFQMDLGIQKIYLADPPPGQADGFLLTADRTANRRGFEEIGIAAQAVDLEALGGLDLLLIFGHYLASAFSPADLKNGLDNVGTKALFAAHQSALDSLVDFIVPVPVSPEKGGSLTNVDGWVQALYPALDFCGDGLPEWQALLDLAKELQTDHRYYWPLTSPETVRRALAEDIPFFQ
ncbi:MAG: (2Fe-2S)-binding protein [Candidatus Aminicenantes bacterium]|nr:(2Fe-2S)-binding protein [Candidatus Aminicenantes bacterium]